MTFETFDQRVEETWHDQQKDNDKDKDNDTEKDDDKDTDKQYSDTNTYDIRPYLREAKACFRICSPALDPTDSPKVRMYICYSKYIQYNSYVICLRNKYPSFLLVSIDLIIKLNQSRMICRPKKYPVTPNQCFCSIRLLQVTLSLPLCAQRTLFS